ncbi:MAG: N-acetylneuraminate synthase family protein, partial [Betaproteobacteria bacterium]
MIIGSRRVGHDNSPYIIAEMSANHNGSYSRALAILDAAANAGADAVKIQLYNPAKLAEARGGRNKIIEGGPWDGRTLLDIYTEGYTPPEWVPHLIVRAREWGMALFPSVFH